MIDDGDAVAAVAAMRDGDVAAPARVLEAEPGLAASRLNGVAKGRTPLHIVSDWPGYFPNGPAVATLVAVGCGTRQEKVIDWLRSRGAHSSRPSG